MKPDGSVFRVDSADAVALLALTGLLCVWRKKKGPTDAEQCRACSQRAVFFWPQ